VEKVEPKVFDDVARSMVNCLYDIPRQRTYHHNLCVLSLKKLCEANSEMSEFEAVYAQLAPCTSVFIPHAPTCLWNKLAALDCLYAVSQKGYTMFLGFAGSVWSEIC
jgi:hypothetical protein